LIAAFTPDIGSFIEMARASFAVQVETVKCRFAPLAAPEERKVHTFEAVCGKMNDLQPHRSVAGCADRIYVHWTRGISRFVVKGTIVQHKSFLHGSAINLQQYLNMLQG